MVGDVDTQLTDIQDVRPVQDVDTVRLDGFLVPEIFIGFTPGSFGSGGQQGEH